jgi:putative ABC transport system permease protein
MSRSFAVTHALLSHWWRHKMQLATLIFGLMSATALWSGVQAINQQARDSYDRAAATFGGGTTAMLVGRDSPALSQNLFVALRRAGWRVSPVLEGRVLIGETSFKLLGIEPLSLPQGAGPAPSLQADGLQKFMLPPGQTLLARETLADLHLSEGAQPVVGDTTIPPLTVQATLPPGVLIVDIGVAQRILKMPGQVSRLLVANEGINARLPLETIAGDRLRFVEAGSENDLQRLTDSFHLNLTAFGLLSFLVGLFIVNSAIGLAFEQHLPMLRTLRACGVSARELTFAVGFELVSFALLAGFAGLICGYVISAFLLPDVAATLRGLYGAQVPDQLSLKPSWWIAGLAMSVLGAMAAAANSLFRVYRLPVLVSAQPYAWQQAQQRWLTRQGTFAVVVIAVAIGALLFGDSLAAGFAVLAALLLGAALLLPVVLAVLLRLGERISRRPLTKWFYADSRQQLSGLSLALMALLLALAVNVGVGTMVESFSKTFVAWLDNRLAADVYLNAKDDKQATEIVNWLRQRNDVEAILPSWRASATVAGGTVEVLGFADDAIYRDRWPLLDSIGGAWDQIRSGQGAYISEQLARRLRLKPGDPLALPTPTGAWPVIVAGIYPDYGNPKGQIGVDNDALARHWPDTPHMRYGLRVAPGRVTAVIDGLREAFRLDATHLLDQQTLKAESTRIFNRTFAVTSALNAFTLGVAGIALLTSLLTLSNTRLPQLAPLWSMGLTRRRLAGLEFLKTLSVALITALLAMPLGLAVAWCLVAVVNVKAFGWRLPLYLFPLQMFELLLTALAAAAFATIIPMVRLIKMPPVQLMKTFANER